MLPTVSRALDGADVVALDAHRRAGQPERRGQLLERGERPALVGQPAGLLARERLGGVPAREGHELALLAALRHAEADRPAAPGREERLQLGGVGQDAAGTSTSAGCRVARA